MKKQIMLIFITLLTINAVAVSLFASQSKDINVLPVNHSNPFAIDVWIDKSAVNTGDFITVSFRASVNCYLVLVDHGSSGNMSIIYPNQFSGPDNYIQAGRVYTFPASDAGFKFRISGPAGEESILAYASLRSNTVAERLGLTRGISGFKSVNQKQFKDIVVEESRNSSSGEWATARRDFMVIGGSQGSGTIYQQPQSIQADELRPSPNAYSSIFLLSVGVSTGELRGCENDARDFARVMGRSLGVPTGNIKIISGESATLNGIRKGFEWARQNMDSKDMFIYYFSGHGSYIADNNGDEVDGYDEVLLPYGFNANDITTMIIDDELGQWLMKIPGNKKVAIIDACHSGTITKAVNNWKTKSYKGGVLGQGKPSASIVSKSGHGTGEFGQALLAATTDALQALEINGRGLFTFEMIKAIEGGAPDLNSAFKMSRARVLELSAKQQDPVITDPAGLSSKILFR
ncbi:exported hypothetical protein [Desulfamplus magnetovallimortis]|uniref:Uncharacterized protein n=1 Tax=Desulfamplus magnetovallimortis TaxID=1246637 RepID=A0A1W1H4W0_9BACT|nr:DUF4384 domain-containing protein [Desulfamplus magnetovallimortis]SLM27484.1 exported hypothetical protein [Desulfamplus magnetovallimortis]